MIWIGITVGGALGAWLGSTLDKGSAFGAWSIIIGTIGSLIGVWIGYKFAQNYL